jgi:hypothetical protein
LRKASPAWARKLARRVLPVNRYNAFLWAAENPFVGTDKEWSYKGISANTIGIIFDPAHYHKYYMSACIDMQVSYKVIDIRKNGWIDELKNSGCNMIVVWPLISTIVLKEMVDERLRIINDDLKIKVYPPPGEVWLLDNKRRVRDWLIANGFAAPGTWCFFNRDEAMQFTEKAGYPVVFKTVRGSVSHGVIICRDKNDAQKLVKQCFGKGVVPERSDPRNSQWDFAMFQEYLPDVEEKRMIRIGESYICIDKVKVGDFHSGSGYMKWGDPGANFLELTKQVTDKGNFKSMNVDFFMAKDGRVLVNELHTLFHGPVIPDSELKGRYINENGQWKFEPGNYYRNYCCNLRIQNLLKEFGEDKADFKSWLNLPAFS